MKRCLDDNGTPVETIVNTFSSSISPTPSTAIVAAPRSMIAVTNSNITYPSREIVSTTQYPIGSTSPVHSFSAIMPTLTVHDKPSNTNTIPVGTSLGTTIHAVPVHNLPAARCKMHTSVVSTNAAIAAASITPSSTVENAANQQFQRLKVEDALSYLDQVKYKFCRQPQVYNDFLDIMKEFKSQSIDTPGVITRVSNLFKGHPELIVGFNTFLPPGYKIEVQSSESGGYSFQVSVSIPSPSSSTSTLVPSTQTVLHTATISNVTSTVTTTASTLLGNTLSIVNSPAVTAAKPLTMPSSTMPPMLNVPLTIPPATTVPVPQQSAVVINSVVNNVVVPSTVSSMPNSSPTQTFTMNPAHMAVSQALIHVESGIANQPIPQNQPVEFNHAINYVNKIKNRFQGQPDKYKRFLEILHTYQKEQRTLKENQSSGAGKTLTEAEVYSQVAKLFENQEDLLAEFGQFLPDATSHQSSFTTKNNEQFNSRKPPANVKPSFNNAVLSNSQTSVVPSAKFANNAAPSVVTSIVTSSVTSTTPGIKRSASMSNSHTSSAPAVKKHKSQACLRDITLSEAGKYGTLNDFAFFDRIRKTMHNSETYRNFLRCLMIYNNEIINEQELVQLTTPFLSAHPELLRWFKEFLGQSDKDMYYCREESKAANRERDDFLDNVYNNVVRTENSIDIDYTTCKRIGASYCAVPDDFMPPQCAGRDELCREVLNDTWVSFPSWSEDSTFVSSRKTQYEEYIYRCEDERFELDVVIETNAATIKAFDALHKKLSRMSTEEASKYKSEEHLSGTCQRAIRRIYGDKASDIIEGLRKNPAAAVPVVLRRLKMKEEEWREAQKGFNKIWREQNEKFYLKSLDHQGMNFKQNDMKYLRSKSLLNEIEALFDERHENGEENGTSGGQQQSSGPHMVLPYRDKTVLDDAANLLIHHVKRQTGIHKEDKQKIKSLIRQFLPDLFYHPRQELSDDEREDTDVEKPRKGDNDEASRETVPAATSTTTDEKVSSLHEIDTNAVDTKSNGVKLEPNADDIRMPIYALSCHPDECYTLFFADNHWYLFLRLHQILCDRLSKMYERATILAKQESSSKETRAASAAISLRLKPKPDIEIEEYYPAMLDMVKNVLDGNLDSTTYEDTLREMFGIHAYVAFTLDKVVSHAVRQLQYLVTDETCQDCYELFMKERQRGSTGGPCVTAHQRVNVEANYQKKIEASSMESCFKILVYKIDCRLTIECLDTDGDNEDTQDNEKWNNFAENDSLTVVTSVTTATTVSTTTVTTSDVEKTTTTTAAATTTTTAVTATTMATSATAIATPATTTPILTTTTTSVLNTEKFVLGENKDIAVKEEP